MSAKCWAGWAACLWILSVGSAAWAQGASSGASDDDVLGSSCHDGYERGALRACEDLQPGVECTQANGSRGQCAQTRCTRADGTALLLCVALRGQDAPAPHVPDAGAANDTEDTEDASIAALGGGCSTSGGASGAAGCALLAGALLARRRRR